MKRFFRTALVLNLLFLFMAPLRAGAESALLAEASLTTPSIIHAGRDGRVYVADEDQKIIWRINPANNSYERYDSTGNMLVDVEVDNSGKIWWTDGAEIFGYFNTAVNPQMLDYWTVPKDDQGDLPNIGPLVLLNNQVWMANWYSVSNVGIYRFTPGSGELCRYSFEKGSFASDLVVQNGRLWWLNWQYDLLMSLTTTGELVGYNLKRSIDIGAGMLADGDYLWWAEGTLNGKIVRFEPATEKITLFSVPDGTQPMQVSALDGGIWYSDAKGRLGRLDAKSTAGTQEQLSQSISTTITPICPVQAAHTATDGAPSYTGTLTWSDVQSQLTQPAGLDTDVYSLPAGASPSGIAAVGRSIWLADSARDKLLRLDLNVNVYIPAVFNK